MLKTQITRVPEGSEGFRKVCQKGCFSISCSAAVPEGSGRFPEGLPEALFGSFQFRCSSEGSGRVTGSLFGVVVFHESQNVSGSPSGRAQKCWFDR